MKIACYLVVFGSFIIGIYYSLTFPLEKPNIITPTRQISTAQHPSSKSSIDDLNLFGKFKEEASITTPIFEIKKDLALDLSGLFFSSDEKAAAAILRTPEGDDQVLRLGEKIDGQVVLVDFYDKGIIIEVENKKYKLELSEKALPNSSTHLREPEGSNLPERNVVNEPQEEKYKEIRRLATTQLGLELVAPGQDAGYRVTENSTKIIGRYDLEPGDIIYSANGFPLGTMYSEKLAMDSYESSGSVVFEVHRGGRQLNVSYP